MTERGIMRLTKKKAIEISIERWTWLAETGDYKWNWPGRDEYGPLRAHCALCEYSARRLAANKATWEEGKCPSCPYFKKFGPCYGDTPYLEWITAPTLEDRKLHAAAFLAQLKQL